MEKVLDGYTSKCLVVSRWGGRGGGFSSWEFIHIVCRQEEWPLISDFFLGGQAGKPLLCPPRSKGLRSGSRAEGGQASLPFH